MASALKAYISTGVMKEFDDDFESDGESEPQEVAIKTTEAKIASAMRFMKITDKPGEFMNIPKEQIYIDHSYQRPECHDSKIIRIASGWSWMACAVLVVVRRVSDEVRRFYAVDGQQRAAAARRRDDILSLPCIVFESHSTEEEAMAFLKINTERRPLKALEKFGSRIVLKDKDALLVQRLVVNSGYSLVSTVHANRKEIKCVDTLLKLAGSCPDVLVEVWPLLVELAAGGQISMLAVNSLVYIQKNIVDPDASLLKKPWRDRLIAAGIGGIDVAARSFAKTYDNGGSRIWAAGVVNLLNKRLRNKLVVNGIEDFSS
jgi:hypothetical protein